MKGSCNRERRMFQIVLERPDGRWTFPAHEDEFLLYAMQDNGIECPAICEQGWCLACAARVVSGTVDRSAALTNYAEDAASGFVLLCSTRPLSDLVLFQDIRETRRALTQQRINLNQLARAYPPGKRAGFRRGRACGPATESHDQINLNGGKDQ
jgi:ferredoxin